MHTRVLIVEDEPLIALEIEDILSGAGYKPVGPVMTVAAALAIISQSKVDCAVLDGNLSGVAVDPIATELLHRRIPFVFVSGGSAEQLPPELAHVPFMKKPVHPATLIEMVRAINMQPQPN